MAVDTIINGDAASSTPPGTAAVLEITAAGAFHATTGCPDGSLSGSAAVHGGRISFTAITATPCTGDSNPLDVAVRRTLKAEVSYTIDAQRLTITGSDRDGLALSAQPN